jgi:multidrug resistance protein, MATE family
MDAALSTPAAQPKTASLAEEVRALFHLGWPLALAQAGQAMFGLADTAIVGRLSAQAQGAVGLANALFIGISVLGMGLMMSLDPLVSQALGAQQPARARSFYWQGVWLALLMSGVLAIPIAVAPLLLPLAGVEKGLAHETGVYLWCRLPQLPVMLLFIATRSYLQGIGRSRVLFTAAVIANIANATLCWLFVFPLGLGVAGAGFATVLTATVQFAIAAVQLGPAPDGTQRRMDRSGLLKMLRVGLPIGLQMGAEVSVFALAGILAGAMGEASIAAHQIAIQWASFTFCLAVGVGAAASVRVGHAVGAKDTAAARRSGFAAIGLGVGIMSTSALLFFTFPLVPAHVMTARPDVLAVVVGLLMVTSVFQVFDGVQAVAAGALRGAGDTRFPFWANVAGHYGVGLPIALLLGLKLGLGVVGLWWGLCAGLIAVAVTLAARFHALTRRDVSAL